MKITFLKIWCFIGLFFLFGFTAKAVTLLSVPQGGTGAGTFTSGECLVGNGTGAVTTTTCGAGGYTNLTSFVDQTAWRVFYSDSLGDVTELAFGTSGQYLKANGVSSAPTWDTPGGAGDMLKAVYDTGENNIVDTAEDLTCTDCINATEIEDIYILKTGYSTGALTSDLNIDSNGFVISYDDNKIGLGTATPAYKLDVNGSIKTNGTYYGDYWVSSTGNSMNMQPTGDTDDFFSFKTPVDRPTIKREGGKYIYIESSNVNDVGISFRKDADHSGTVNYYKDTNEFGLTSKDPLVFKVSEDYDDYIKILTVSNVPEIFTVGAADLKINAGGSNSLLFNHAGGNVAVGATSTSYILGLGTGDTFGIGTTQWNSADEIDGTKIKDADYGDVVIDAAGDWQVSEATALAANGANCSANQYPLGIDASGAVESCTADANTTYVSSDFTHDNLTGFVANEHLDWTASVGTIHTDNYVENPFGASIETGEITSDTITHADIADSDQADSKCLWFEDPTANDDFKSIWRNSTANAFQITEIWAESDQTVTFMLQVDDGAPADCDSVDLAPAAGEAEDTSLNGDCLVSASEELDLAVTSVSGTPTWVSICFTGNWVD